MAELTREEAALTKGAGYVRDAHGALTSQISALPANLQTKGAWEGGGAGGFTNLITAWTRETGEIVKALEVFEANLIGSDKTYTATDQAQQDKYTQIAGRMSQS